MHEGLPWAELPGLPGSSISFLQGLDGAKGEKGDSGEKGDQGDTGPAVSCFPKSHLWLLAETCLTGNNPNALFLFNFRVSRVLQGSLVYLVPKEKR